MFIGSQTDGKLVDREAEKQFIAVGWMEIPHVEPLVFIFTCSLGPGSFNSGEYADFFYPIPH